MKGKDIYDIFIVFFLRRIGLDWKNLVGCTTDGAPSMLSSRSGFQSYVKAVSPNVTVLFIGSPYAQKCCMRSC